MVILVFKLFITPLFIGSVTLAGRRWGPVVSGLLIGLPLTSGPVSFILAHQYGPQFTTKAAVGSLVGEASFCIFCLAYSLTAKKNNWLISVLSGIIAFLMATFLWNHFSWQLLPAFIVVLVVIALVVRLIPHHSFLQNVSAPPRWDLPVRMIIATSFVILLTTFANLLGPQLSGLISPFPVFGLVLAAFMHSQQGAKAASNLLRSVVLGSVSFAFFFLIVGALLTHLGIGMTFGLASMAAVMVSAIVYFITRKESHAVATH
jgi:hypothetical protein